MIEQGDAEDQITRDKRERDLPEHAARWQALEERFFTAGSRGPASEERLESVKRIRGAVLDVAWLIETNVPAGRDKALAFTHLEDVLIRAGRGIFAPREEGTR